MTTSRRHFLTTLGIGATTGLAGCLGDSSGQTMVTVSSMPIHHQTPTCGCCGSYTEYFEDRVDSDVEVKNHENIDPIKAEHEIPEDIRSCHTIEIEDYFVEGHVPAPSIAKLVEEKPDAKGIAVPGMPQGSPGMGGMEAVEVFIVRNDDSSEPFEYSEYVNKFDGV